MDLAPAPVCTRCGHAPKLPGQRVCRTCLTGYQRDRRARRRQQTAGVGEASLAEVVTQPAPMRTERPLALCRYCGPTVWMYAEVDRWLCPCGSTYTP